MSVNGNQPVSVADLAAAMQSASTGGIGDRPVSVDDLKACMDNVFRGKVLFRGKSYGMCQLSEDPSSYDTLLVIAGDDGPNANSYILLDARMKFYDDRDVSYIYMSRNTGVATSSKTQWFNIKDAVLYYGMSSSEPSSSGITYFNLVIGYHIEDFS